MRKAAVIALVLVSLVLELSVGAAGAFAQGRPRRVDPSQTVPPPQSDRSTRGDPANQPSDVDDSVTLEGALIEVPTVVADRSGHYVPQLRQQDFRVLEDGVEQDISFFSSERVPIHVAIVMDTSGSTRDTIYDIQEAAIEFINQLLPGDQVLIVSFANQVIVEQEFTNDRRALAQAIRRTQANGSTKLYEAVYLAVAERLRHVDGRKAMVILSDGEDTSSKDVSFDEAVNICSESDVVVYGIRYPESSGTSVYSTPGGNSPFPVPNTGPFPQGYPQPRKRKNRTPQISIPFPWPNSPKWPLAPTGSSFAQEYAMAQFPGRSPGNSVPQANMGRSAFMETITTNTGGTLFYAGSISNVGALFAIIAEELRNVYVIGYSPSNSLAKGGYRRITVQVPRQPDLAIRHRLGYQAEAYAAKP